MTPVAEQQIAAPVEHQVVIGFLPKEDYWRILPIYQEAGEELPVDNTEILAIAVDGELVGTMAFHHVLMIGHCWIKTGEKVGPLLSKAADSLFNPGERVFANVIGLRAKIAARQQGMEPIGELWRKDY